MGDSDGSSSGSDEEIPRDASGEPMDIVKRILDVRWRGNPPRLLYHVRWSGYPNPKDYTWEPEEHFVLDDKGTLNMVFSEYKEEYANVISAMLASNDKPNQSSKIGTPPVVYKPKPRVSPATTRTIRVFKPKLAKAKLVDEKPVVVKIPKKKQLVPKKRVSFKKTARLEEEIDMPPLDIPGVRIFKKPSHYQPLIPKKRRPVVSDSDQDSPPVASTPPRPIVSLSKRKTEICESPPLTRRISGLQTSLIDITSSDNALERPVPSPKKKKKKKKKKKSVTFSTDIQHYWVNYANPVTHCKVKELVLPPKSKKRAVHKRMKRIPKSSMVPESPPLTAVAAFDPKGIPESPLKPLMETPSFIPFIYDTPINKKPGSGDRRPNPPIPPSLKPVSIQVNHHDGVATSLLDLTLEPSRNMGFIPPQFHEFKVSQGMRAFASCRAYFAQQEHCRPINLDLESTSPEDVSFHLDKMRRAKSGILCSPVGRVKSSGERLLFLFPELANKRHFTSYISSWSAVKGFARVQRTRTIQQGRLFLVINMDDVLIETKATATVTAKEKKYFTTLRFDPGCSIRIRPHALDVLSRLVRDFEIHLTTMYLTDYLVETISIANKCGWMPRGIVRPDNAPTMYIPITNCHSFLRTDSRIKDSRDIFLFSLWSKEDFFLILDTEALSWDPRDRSQLITWGPRALDQLLDVHHRYFYLLSANSPAKLSTLIEEEVHRVRDP